MYRSAVFISSNKFNETLNICIEITIRDLSIVGRGYFAYGMCIFGFGGWCLWFWGWCIWCFQSTNVPHSLNKLHSNPFCIYFVKFKQKITVVPTPATLFET